MFVVVLLRSRRKEKAIKERISMDLHDEVGTTLTRALYVARLDSGAGRDNRLIHYLNESLFSLRAYINTMNTPSFPFLSLVDEVKEMVHSLMSPSPCHCEVRHVTDGEYLVRGELYRDIRLCLYEIINNMLKHSGGDRLRIVLIARRGLMTLQTTDNGTLQSTDDLSDRGNGIRNLQKRVSKHGGELRMSVGRSGSGLVVRMRFPLRT
jgi:signal transduction histidine kinase